MRRKTAQSALKALDKLQEDFDQAEMTKHMDRSLQKERLLKEIEVRRKQEEQLKRREEVLKAIEEKEKEKEKKIQQANEEIKEMHQALLRSEQEAEEELRAAEEREKREKAKGLDEKAVEVPLMAVKMEEEDDVEPLQELSSLRMCGYCHQKMYLRKGLCANLMCSAFYMNNPRAPELLCAKGPIHHGAKWSPGEWQSSLKDKVETVEPDYINHRGRLTHVQKLHFEGQDRLCQKCWQHPCTKRTKPHDHAVCCCQVCYEEKNRARGS